MIAGTGDNWYQLVFLTFTNPQGGGDFDGNYSRSGTSYTSEQSKTVQSSGSSGVVGQVRISVSTAVRSSPEMSGAVISYTANICVNSIIVAFLSLSASDCSCLPLFYDR